MSPTANLDTVLRRAVKCLGGLLVTSGAVAADSGSTSASAAALRTATWQEAVQYITQWLPACREYSRSDAVVSIRDDRVFLYYADVNYGTTDSFPLRSAFTAEAHGSGDNSRLLVHFREDVVTTDIPNLNGHGRSDMFFCDGDRDTTEGLGVALTRLHQLRASGLTPEEPDSGHPEIVIQNRRDTGKRMGDGERITLSARVSAADLDLSTTSGADELRARVSDKAHILCRQLELRSPAPDTRANQRCVQDAVSGSAKRIDELVAAAMPRSE